MVRILFKLYLGVVAALLWNLIANLALFASGVGSGHGTDFGLSVLFMIGGTIGAWTLWYVEKTKENRVGLADWERKTRKIPSCGCFDGLMGVVFRYLICLVVIVKVLYVV